MHSSTKAVPNRVFYSESIELKSKALDNIENAITKKEQNDIEIADFVLFENKFIKNNIIIFKDDKKSKEIIAARLELSIEKNSFCRVLVSESINTNFGSNDIIYTDYCCLLRYETDAYEAQCRF